MQFSKDLVGFSTPLIILVLLSAEAQYGYGLIRKVREETHGKLHLSEGSLYPLLKKMQKKGLIRSRGKRSTSGKVRKYYFITSRGLARLDDRYREWNTMDGILRDFWKKYA